MAPPRNPVPQEIIDQIVSLVLDAIESRPAKTRYRKFLIRRSFAMRLVSKAFNKTFTNLVFTTHTARLDIGISKRTSNHPFKLEIANASMAIHRSFREHGTSLRIFFPAQTTDLMKDLAKRMGYFIWRCKSVQHVEIVAELKSDDRRVFGWKDPLEVEHVLEITLSQLFAGHKKIKIRYVQFVDGVQGKRLVGKVGG